MGNNIILGIWYLINLVNESKANLTNLLINIFQS